MNCWRSGNPALTTPGIFPDSFAWLFVRGCATKVQLANENTSKGPFGLHPAAVLMQLSEGSLVELQSLVHLWI
jgi:hypothetical protein